MQIFSDFWDTLARQAIGLVEVKERMVLVAEPGPVQFGQDIAVARNRDLVEVINDSGVPFTQQSASLIKQARATRPQAVLLGGTAQRTRRSTPGQTQRILAAQMFAPAFGIRLAQVATVRPALLSPIAAIEEPERIPCPPSWAEEILHPDPRY
ncbi:hypothetical protein GCM10029978_066840 [Actinoallomurus acanthiterrae]